jgi:hypothetical protein
VAEDLGAGAADAVEGRVVGGRALVAAAAALDRQRGILDRPAVLGRDAEAGERVAQLGARPVRAEQRLAAGDGVPADGGAGGDGARDLADLAVEHRRLDSGGPHVEAEEKGLGGHQAPSPAPGAGGRQSIAVTSPRSSPAPAA